MDRTSLRCLINSISRFIHLVSCKRIKIIPIEKDYKNMVVVLKLLKPLLDEVVDYETSPDEFLYQQCEELDMVVNEAREFLESWSPKMSKICSVLRSESFLMKMQSSSVQICHILCRLLQSSSTSIVAAAQRHMQEIKCLKHERVTEHIECALRCQDDDVIRYTDHLTKIIEALGLMADLELLKETIAIEKERVNVQVGGMNRKLDQINQIVDLMSHIRDRMLKIERFEPTSGILIPSYFRCPMSLELMSDPIIVASGQTYHRPSIQKWLDNGLTICPKTRQKLSHTNLIPNYTVKAMIASWCEENNIQLLNNSEQCCPLSVSHPLNHITSQDLIHTDSFRCSLHSSSSGSRLSIEVGNGFEKQKADASSRSSGECNGCQSREVEKTDCPSPEQSYCHSRTESASSVISSVDYMPQMSSSIARLSTRHESGTEPLEISAVSPATSHSIKESEFSPWSTNKELHNARTNVQGFESGSYNYNLAQALVLSDSGCDNLTTNFHVEKLVEDLKNPSSEVQATAAAELRLLAKNNMDNRIIIGSCGAITPLISLLYSELMLTQEHAVTTLLNLSINEDNKALIAEAGVIEPLIHVLKSGNDGARENAAAALFSLASLEEYKAKIGRSGAVKALVDLLASGTERGKKDAATALFKLSIFHENKARIVKAGAVKYLVEFLDPASGMVDKAVALLANLSTIGEGRLAIAREGGIPLLVELVESGSLRSKENAAAILLQLCLNSSKFCTFVLQEGAVPPLVALSQSGTPRGREKAQQLLSHFRSQRGGAMGKNKP